MRKRMRKVLALFALAVTMLATVPEANAAAKAKTPSLTETKLRIGEGRKWDINIKNKVKGSKYKWTSSNTKVAKVNAKNGLVTARKLGKATISCKITLPTKKIKTLKCKVTVITTEQEDAELSEEFLKDYYGDRYPLYLKSLEAEKNGDKRGAWEYYAQAEGYETYDDMMRAVRGDDYDDDYVRPWEMAEMVEKGKEHSENDEKGKEYLESDEYKYTESAEYKDYEQNHFDEIIYLPDVGREFIDYMNTKRVEAGLSPIVWDDTIAVETDKRAADLITDYSHNGRNPKYAEIIQYYPMADLIVNGEVETFYQRFYDSKVHHDIMFNVNYTRGAASVVRYQGNDYIAVNFIF